MLKSCCNTYDFVDDAMKEKWEKKRSSAQDIRKICL